MQAFAAQARVVMCPAPAVQGLQRTLFGGILLEAWTTSDRWTRVDGTLILVPRQRARLKRQQDRGQRLDQVVTWLMHEDAAWEPKG
jgi:hypothetical protein